MEALDYLIKPVSYEDFALRLQKARRYIARNKDEVLRLHVAGGTVMLKNFRNLLCGIHAS